MIVAACEFLDARVLVHLARNDSQARRPELMDLKPLPKYETLEEAQKALGARPIPTAEAVREALRELAAEEGADEDEDQGDAYQTALANNPSDYFGFVG
ncbi:hypothetical protein H632_c1818p0 [Helicosporidium sp. ATCC 50920]|nr:hypothetical protein H632_c1818p0 [Helicosporidium sp. ATCC 50920]|eukprot:KDD73812.1 hypothetical protein H632_c1818p0 [Helicosporidium sp. ATCC 50920]